jgi:hypothetical protein
VVTCRSPEVIIAKICEELRPLRPGQYPSRSARQHDAHVRDYLRHQEVSVSVIRQRIEGLRRELDSKSPTGNLIANLPAVPPDDRQESGPFAATDRVLQWAATVKRPRYDRATRNDAFIACSLIVEYSQRAPTGTVKGPLHGITSYIYELRTGVQPKPGNLRRAVYWVVKVFELYEIV